MSKIRKSSGWNTLWPWVIAVFAIVIGAWTWLIRTASEHAPEEIPIERSSEKND